ncbi:MAG: DUF11 domain-containing protein [Bacteroidetes bacterium]|nr:DUF11 domain-containing protein [Bacteroidota bacterium]
MRTLNIGTMLVLWSGLLFGQGTALTGGAYEMQANAFLKLKNGKVALTAVRHTGQTKEDSVFGYWFSSKPAGTETFIELKEGPRSLVAVTAKDFIAKAKIENNGTTTTATYSADRIGVTMILTAELVSDAGLPKGNAVRYSLAARSNTSRTLSGEMLLHADGFVQKIGSNGVSASRVEKGKPAFPYILSIGREGTVIAAEKGDAKMPGRGVRFTGTAAAVGTELVTLLSFHTMLTTVASTEKALAQGTNVEQFLSAKRTKTEMALLNTASKANPFPGDTITYYITYHNIGTSPAEDLTISNPIPANTTYVEKSAQGDDTEISLERKKVNLPQIGAVTSINWKVKKRINPGEEGTVSLRAVIK